MCGFIAKIVVFYNNFNFYAFLITLALHFGQVTSILPTPLGTRMLALQFLQRK